MRYFISEIAYECSLELKPLPDNASLIKVKYLEICLPCSLVLKVVVNFKAKLKSLLSVYNYFAACLINYLSIVFIHRLFIQYFKSGNKAI